MIIKCFRSRSVLMLKQLLSVFMRPLNIIMAHFHEILGHNARLLLLRTSTANWQAWPMVLIIVAMSWENIFFDIYFTPLKSWCYWSKHVLYETFTGKTRKNPTSLFCSQNYNKETNHHSHRMSKINAIVSYVLLFNILFKFEPIRLKTVSLLVWYKLIYHLPSADILVS